MNSNITFLELTLKPQLFISQHRDKQTSGMRHKTGIKQQDWFILDITLCKRLSPVGCPSSTFLYQMIWKKSEKNPAIYQIISSLTTRESSSLHLPKDLTERDQFPIVRSPNFWNIFAHLVKITSSYWADFGPSFYFFNAIYFTLLFLMSILFNILISHFPSPCTLVSIVIFIWF